MKAALLTSFGKSLELSTIPIPYLKCHEILVKMRACGCCHTDLHIMENELSPLIPLPLSVGHEGVGDVFKIGEQVTNINVGDVVGLPWLYSACGHCEYCISGWETVCSAQLCRGYNVNGCFRQYAVADASHAIQLPRDTIYTEVAPILCAGVTSYKAIKESECRPGQYLTIIGAAGGLGHLAIQYAKAMGLRVIAVDKGCSRLAFCKEIGAEFTIDIAEHIEASHETKTSGKDEAGHQSSMEKAIMDLTKGGSHGVICLANHLPTFYMAVQCCRPLGTVVCVSLPRGNFEVPTLTLVTKRITVRGSIVGTRQDMLEALDFYHRGLVKCLIAVEPFDNINDVFEKLRHNQYPGRVVLTFEH